MSYKGRFIPKHPKKYAGDSNNIIPDFIVKVKRKDGTVMTHVIEVKPEYQTKQPVRKRKTQKFINEYITYTINQSKWKAATEFCKDRGWEFRILTEKNLGII
jgi:hypothetical protein